MALLTSLAIHVVATAACGWCFLRGNQSGAVALAVPLTTINVDLERQVVPVERSSRGATGISYRTPNTPAQWTSTQDLRPHPLRPDTRQPGRGGTDLARDPALNLAATIDTITLDRNVYNSREQGQLARNRTAEFRSSLDDRTSDPHPMELSFIATGEYAVGVNRLARLGDVGSHDGVASTAASALPDTRGPSSEGELVSAPRPASEMRAQPGELGGQRNGSVRLNAAATLARPLVTPGRRAVPTATFGDPADLVSSSQRVANLVQSLVHASTAGGQTGPGQGGQNGPPTSGSGGPPGPGSISSHSGHGTGQDAGRDPRVFPYLGQMLRRVEPHWRHAFPEWAIARGLGGLATIGVTVLGDGRIRNLRIVRPSGIAEFDRNVLEAVRRAAPYGPLPPELGTAPLSVCLSFDATNPAVGRNGPGPGQWRP